MVHWTRRCIVIGLLLFATVARTESVVNIKTAQEAEAFTQSYYRHPSPATIANLIEALNRNAVFNRREATYPWIGFFSEVFADNQGMVSTWQALGARQDVPTAAVLKRALEVKQAGGVTSIVDHSPELNDMYWGAFFATGRDEFLMKLIDQLVLSDERTDFNLYLAGASAKWSLASNALSHPDVRAILESLPARFDKRTREIVAELLEQGAVRVRQEIRDVIATQRALGKWLPAPASGPR
jgi:hypothetical protein